jgi:hypothetical protein
MSLAYHSGEEGGLLILRNLPTVPFRQLITHSHSTILIILVNSRDDLHFALASTFLSGEANSDDRVHNQESGLRSVLLLRF